MSAQAKAKVFYGVRIDESRYPAKVNDLLAKWDDPEEALSIYLLEKAGYVVSDEYGADDELAQQTGIVVLGLGDSGVYLAVTSTIGDQGGYGISQFDLEAIGMEQYLTLEKYAGWLGTKVRLGDWHIWVGSS
jgi:hypothetical protein